MQESINKRMNNKLQYIYPEEYYRAKKMNELYLFINMYKL